MSMTWHPASWEILVENPGFGQLTIVASPHADLPIVAEEWSIELAGAEVGALLEQITARAFQADGDPAPEDTKPMPAFVTPAIARRLLPSLQQAVLLAVGGTDRYERILPDDDEPPAEPYCARCGKGTIFTPGSTQSEWCDRHGHRPFGFREGWTWDLAVETQETRRGFWERKRELRELGFR